MISRAYLSIGDVLTLLREEFPDVTISKIRFLESQGLVNPERSPSGYRKFYEHDVERLRWVLRQQREHFLPLKVIRDRLASGDLGSPEPVGASVGAPEQHVARPSGAAAVAEVPATRAPNAASATSPPSPASPVGTSNGMSGRPAAHSAPAAPFVSPVRAGSVPPVSTRPTPAPSRPLASTAVVDPEPALPGGEPDPSSDPDDATASAGRPPAHARPEEPGDESPAEPAVRPTAAPPESGLHGGPAEPKDDAAPGPTRPARAPESGGPAHVVGDKGSAPSRSAETLGADVSGVSLTVEELCGATGLSAEQTEALTSFGLIESMVVAGVAYYGEEALTVSRLAAAFAQYGIEPRHLRLFRNAVDREIGLVEQVILPLLRQRNPESRQRAVEAAADIAQLGEGLRSSLVRQALRRELGN